MAEEYRKQNYEDFYHKFRRKISAYLENHNSRFAEILLLGPDLFHLLLKLSFDPRVSSGKKAKFIAVLVYFVSPLDFLPEALLGILGYVDDITLTAYVLNDFINENTSEIVREHWAGDQDLLSAIKSILFAADRVVGSGLWKKLRYCFR